MSSLVVDPARFDADVLEIRGEAYHHLFRALRLQVGERIRLVDGEGRARWGEVVGVDRRVGRVRGLVAAPHNEPALELHLAVGALRVQRASWLVEKATEVGVRSILWYRSERSLRSYGESTFERLRRVAVAAVEQCDRARVPELDGMLAWERLEERVRQMRTLFLDPGGERLQDSPLREGRTALLVVGPEGGWSERERRRLVDAGAGCASLGERVLRVETAALVGCALLLV